MRKWGERQFGFKCFSDNCSNNRLISNCCKLTGIGCKKFGCPRIKEFEAEKFKAKEYIQKKRNNIGRSFSTPKQR